MSPEVRALIDAASGWARHEEGATIILDLAHALEKVDARAERAQRVVEAVKNVLLVTLNPRVDADLLRKVIAEAQGE